MSTRIHAEPIATVIKQAHAAWGEYLARLVQVAIKRARRRVRLWMERIALAQHQRELLMLLQADDRMLMDIGVTRAEVRAAIEGGWWPRSREIEETAAARRSKFTRAPRAPRPALPRVAAPSLAPEPTKSAVEVSNFR